MFQTKTEEMVLNNEWVDIQHDILGAVQRRAQMVGEELIVELKGATGLQQRIVQSLDADRNLIAVVTFTAADGTVTVCKRVLRRQ
jgi:hypothetical protein